MRLPVQISPNPLLSTTVEIRFQLKKSVTNLFSVLYPHLAPELPFLENINQVPKEIKATDANFEYLAEFKLTNNKYSISFSDKSLVIETVGEYPLWENFFNFIKKYVTKFIELNVIENVVRIGVRYRSVFAKNSFDGILLYSPKLQIPGYEENIIANKHSFSKDKYRFTLQLAENVSVKNEENTFFGVLVDIDAYYLTTIRPSLYLVDIINELHLEEKELFFRILTPEFLTSLSPQY